MPRARNIKPSFFTDDELAENCPLGRLLFIGLWTIADYKGELEWREKRIKAQLLPYDDCDIKKIAINLDKSGFIRFYSDGDSVYLKIVNFERHQNPHKNERDKGSLIPVFDESSRQVIDFKGLTINRDKSGSKPESSHSDPADSLNLIPDSLNLIPETVKPESGSAPAVAGVVSEKKPALDFSVWHEPASPEVMKEWQAMKKRLKAPVSQIVINRMAGELKAASLLGHSVDDCLAECITRGWKGFKAEWLEGNRTNGQQRQEKDIWGFNDTNW